MYVCIYICVCVCVLVSKKMGPSPSHHPFLDLFSPNFFHPPAMRGPPTPEVPMEDTKRPIFGAEAERIGTRLDEATDEFLKEPVLPGPGDHPWPKKRLVKAGEAWGLSVIFDPERFGIEDI